MKSAQDNLVEALNFHKAGNSAQAEKLYREVLSSQPDNEFALHFLGMICSQTGKLTEAINFFNRAITINPTGERYLDLGVIYGKMGNVDEAIGCYKSAVKLCIHDACVYHDLALMCYNKDLLNEALEYCNLHMQLDPNNPKILHILGLISARKNQVNEAKSYHLKAIELNPNYAEAYAALGNLYIQDYQVREAVDCYKNAYFLNPEVAETGIKVGNDIRYLLWKEKRRSRAYNQVNYPNINFALVYFYDENLDNALSEDFLSKLDSQKFKECTVYAASTISDELIDKLKEHTHVCFVEQGDNIPDDALLIMADIFSNYPELDLAFSDEDIIETNGATDNPYFKPQYAPFLLYSHNYMNAFLCLKLTEKITKKLKELKEINQKLLYKLVLQLTAEGIKSTRIPDVLYHRHYSNQEKLEKLSTSDMVQEALCKKGYNAIITDSSLQGFNQVKLLPEGNPKISIIIPFKDKVSLLKTCIESIEQKSTYKNYEIVLINNRSQEPETFEYLRNSKHKYYDADFEFNYSKLINLGASHAEGDYFVFMNNDMEVITPDWLESSLGLAQLPEIGVVGAKLLFPNNKIQHVGMVASYGHLLHVLWTSNPEETNFKNYDKLLREYSSVTGAFHMISRQKFYEVEGYTEQLAIECNDVDFCFKLLNAGYNNVYNPHCVICHYESATRRGTLRSAVLDNRTYLKEKWPELMSNDPFHNPNYSPYYFNYIIRLG